MHIVADENMPALDAFARLGTVTRVDGRRLTAQQLTDADVLLVRSVTQVNGALLDASPVRFVGSATIGTDHVDLDYLAAAGIHFAHAPGCNARAVAEYVLQAALLLGAAQQRRPAQCSLGIVGLGNVGRRVATLLTALGMSVRACDPPLQRRGYDGPVPLCDLDEVLQADLISLHVPLQTAGEDATWHLLDRARINALRGEQMLINSCRGAVIDNQALKQRLRQADAPAVILDVWEGEPSIDAELAALVRSGSPHVAGYSAEGKTAGTLMLYQALCAWQGIEADVPVSAEEKACLNQPVSTDQQLLALLEQGWRIDADFARLRESLTSTDPGAAFDLLRKRYPLRHELHHWHFQGELAEEYQAVVAALFAPTL